MAGKKSFVFYHKWKELLEDLPADDVKGIVFALIDYSESNEIPKTLSPVANQTFKAFRQMIDEDTQKWESTCKRNAENGKNGGRPQKPKKPTGLSGFSEKPKKADNDNDYDNDYDYELTPPTPSKGASNAETVDRNQGENLKVKTAGGNTNHSTTLDEDFNRFWQAYPRKKDRYQAQKAWFKLKPDVELQQIIMNALEQEKQSAQWQKDKKDKQFIPYAATWLNKRRWEDIENDCDTGNATSNQEECEQLQYGTMF